MLLWGNMEIIPELSTNTLLIGCITHESMKVEIGIIEAKFENALRVLKADLQSAMEKQVHFYKMNTGFVLGFFFFRHHLANLIFLYPPQNVVLVGYTVFSMSVIPWFRNSINI